MRLIDADTLIESMALEKAVKWGNRDGYQQDHSYSTLMRYEIKGEIDAQPTIPAVPLEPLCEWLAGYADPPKYAMKIIPESGKYLINARAKAWEHHFKNMMECGLMDEGGKE